MDEEQTIFQQNEKEIFQFLDFASRIMTQMQYLRDTTAIDYLTDTEHLSYELADKIVHALIDEGYLDYSQWGAFPGTEVTEKGKNFLEELKTKYGPIEHEAIQKGPRKTEDKDYINSELPGEPIDTNEQLQLIQDYEHETYAFLDFTRRIMKDMQYLRDQTGIDFLIDNEQIPYEIADKLLHAILNAGYLDYSQWGAFPGTELTEKGLQYFEELKEKYGPIKELKFSINKHNAA